MSRFQHPPQTMQMEMKLIFQLGTVQPHDLGVRKIVAHKQILEQFVLSNGLP